MQKNFSTALLVQHNSDAPEIKISDLKIFPGDTISFDQESNVLIAGGFATISPELRIPLSPTLQLNKDLAGLPEDQLQAVAIAELQRRNGVNYRSYNVDLDNRACVIANDVTLLKRFLDTYSGIVELEPLLVKGYDSEISTVTELNLEAKSDGCRLEYQVKSPINIEKCSYCGDCGSACPEACISENLFVDFGKCTYCKECEKVCGAGAIDIHGVQGKVLELPAVIMLGDLRVELPKGSSNVYYEETLPEFFGTLYPCQVDEVITCDNSICQFSGRLGAGCDLCLSSCHYGAIRQGDGGIEVDPMMCEECGACVASCPTGALQNERFNDESFVSYFSDVRVPEKGTVILGDETAFHRLWWHYKGTTWTDTLFLQVENVFSLSLFHFLFLLNRGAQNVVVVSEGLNGTNAGSNKALAQQTALTNEFVEKLFDIKAPVKCLGVSDCAAFLTEEKSPRAMTAAKDEDGSVEFINRRATVARELQRMVEESGREVTITPDGYIPFATVSCNEEKCTECMACLNDCRIGAMVADQEKLVLGQIPALCVGCGLCVRVCPEDALSITPDFTLAGSFFNLKELAKAEPMACKSCGKVFGTKKSFDKVMAILSKKESVDTTHFEYCEDCRVVRLFDSE
jgi:ferredoxin